MLTVAIATQLHSFCSSHLKLPTYLLPSLRVSVSCGHVGHYRDNMTVLKKDFLQKISEEAGRQFEFGDSSGMDDVCRGTFLRAALRNAKRAMIGCSKKICVTKVFRHL